MSCLSASWKLINLISLKIILLNLAVLKLFISLATGYLIYQKKQLFVYCLCVCDTLVVSA